MQMLTTSEASKALGVDRHTIAIWLREGRLRGKRAGKRWLAEASSVESLRLLRGGRREHG